MIDFIRGEITELSPTGVVLENNGIGYYLNISLNTYSGLSQRKEARIDVYEAIREDAHQLFGFLEKEERELFLLLISVSGVGANTARVILSSLSVPELKQAILHEQTAPLKAVKGIGLKTAQRIIIDLHDKVVATGETTLLPTLEKSDGNGELLEEAVAALTMLGFPAAASQKTVRNLQKEQPDLRVEELIKKALKLL